VIAHYFTAAFASFRKAPFATAANVVTLALGIACFIAAYGIATYWRLADSHHANADRTVVVGQRASRAGAEAGLFNTNSNANLAPALAADFPELAAVARVIAGRDVPVAAEDRKMLLNVANVDPAFLEIFDLEFVAGAAAVALGDPNGVILTQEAAARLFGEEPALGRSVLIGGTAAGEVTGVIAPVRQPSFMGPGAEARVRFDMIRTWEARYGESEGFGDESWLGYGPLTFAVLPPSMSVETFDARLPAFLERRIPDQQRQAATFEAKALPLSALRTQDLDRVMFSRTQVGVSTLSVLLGLGLLTLAVACANYANLATAQAAGRSKEIGMRKVLGAAPRHVMIQAWTEALLLATAAAVAAVVGLAAVSPAIRSATEIDILYFLLQGALPVAIVAGLIVVVAVAAGAYPALALSRVRPATALDAGYSGLGSRWLTRLLVGVQFASASFMLILVTVTELQVAHIERTALAPREDPIVILNDLMPLDVDYDTLATRLAGQPGVAAVSVVDRGPWDMNGDNVMTYGRSPEAGTSASTGYLKSIGYDYFAALNLRVLAGRVFDRERGDIPASPFIPADQPVAVVVDRRYAERLGFSTPDAAVGRTIYSPATSGAPARPAQIIGVTETEVTRVDASNVAGNIYAFFPRAFFGGQHPIVRIERGRVADAVAAITGAWDDLAPDIPVNIRFFDDLFDANFRIYARVSQVFTILAGAAFVIASIGLLGMAVHATSRRRHEIGVRKVLGSTTPGVAGLLLVHFSKPVLVANLLAWPLGYVAAQIYLAAFADRVTLTPAPFVFSMAITLAIALVAVAGEVLRAASLRPAEVLRHA